MSRPRIFIPVRTCTCCGDEIIPAPVCKPCLVDRDWLLFALGASSGLVAGMLLSVGIGLAGGWL